MPIISSAKVHNTGDSPPRSPGLRPGTSHTDEGGNITRINSRPSTASYGGAPSPSETSSSDDSSVFNKYSDDDDEDDDVSDDGMGDEKKPPPSLLEAIKNDEIKVKTRKKKNHKMKMDKSAYSQKRDKLKNKIMKEVLAQVLPDMGAYDLGAIVSGPKVSWFDGFIVDIAKIFGCVSLTLHEAVFYGSMKSMNRTVKKLTKDEKLSHYINQYDKNGRTPLICAIISRRQDRANPNDLLDALLAAGADVNVSDSFNGMTPLLYALFSGEERLGITLLGRGAVVSMCDNRCVTPVMMAASKGQVTVLKILIDKLADIDAVDENGWSCLHYAALHGKAKCIKILTDAGIDRNIRDNHKRRAWHIAAFQKKWCDENPPITKDEILLRHEMKHDECLSLLEDAKSRLAIIEGDIDF